MKAGVGVALMSCQLRVVTVSVARPDAARFRHLFGRRSFHFDRRELVTLDEAGEAGVPEA